MLSFPERPAISGRKTAPIVALESPPGNSQLQFIRFIYWRAGPSVVGEEKQRKVWIQYGAAVARGAACAGPFAGTQERTRRSTEKRKKRSAMLCFDGGHGVARTASGLTLTVFASYHSAILRFPSCALLFRSDPYRWHPLAGIPALFFSCSLHNLE
jgi:hypothetical protein